MKRIIIASLFCATASLAETPMSGDAFDEYTHGKTLTFMENGQAYGVEQYLSGKRVQWAFENDECNYGRWYEDQPGLICFLYETAPNSPQCWNFFKTETGLRARFVDDEPGREIYEALSSTQPMLCPGPEVGV
ncbi:MAG: hypothetical protein ACSHXD_12845 [Marinosulfonomonas sp.]